MIDNFALRQVEEKLNHARGLVVQGSISEELDRQIAGIQRAIERLWNSGARGAQIRALEGSLAEIKGKAMDALRKEAESGRASKALDRKATPAAKIIETFKDGASEKSAARAREVLSRPGHWAHDAFCKEILRVCEANGKIPDDYKPTLARDVATLLKVCPAAGGLVTAMLTRGQPRGSFARRLSTKGNDAIGAAYEIMGTSALCHRESTPSNTKHKAPKLHIDPVKDKLVFGPKAYMNHRYAQDRKVADRSRRTTEGDAQIYRKDRGEIAIDFKHVKESKNGKASTHIGQLKAVAEQIAHDQYKEFHFVSNGKFSASFKEAVEKLNDLLIENGCTTNEGFAPIAIHERVMSISNDPYADGEA